MEHSYCFFALTTCGELFRDSVASELRRNRYNDKFDEDAANSNHGMPFLITMYGLAKVSPIIFIIFDNN